MFRIVRKISKQLQRGDTIVEVLIAMVVITVIIVSMMMLANSSSSSLRKSQEYSQAVNIARAQLEYLRSNNGITTPDVCFDQNGAPTSSPANCRFSLQNKQCDTAVEPVCYLANITSLTTGTAVTYTVHVQWPQIGGTDGNVTMSYRTHN